MLTRGETVFEEFCRDYRIGFQRVHESRTPRERRPDYLIVGHAGTNIVVEVKQFDPTREELHAEESATRGKPVATGTMPGKRMRAAIQTAAPQLKDLSAGDKPAMLVVLDNVRSGSFHSEPYAVLTAFRGLDVIDVALSATDKPRFGPKRPGPKKKLTADANRSISAVGVLHDAFTRTALCIYHNGFASRPLALNEFIGDGIRHFRLIADQRDWEECVSLAP